MKRFVVLSISLALSACATPQRDAGSSSPANRPATPAPPSTANKPPLPAPSTAPKWGKQYYLDDGPGQLSAAELDRIPDAVPREETPHRFANRPYSVFGVDYEPTPPVPGFSQRGLASWYGRRFHGKPTSSGEPYDMYAMTAAHPTLSIPSYVRVTNLANGRSVVVRVNDRGPFHPNRIIDLSYAAAHRLGYVNKGSTEVLVEALPAGDISPADLQATTTMGGSWVQLGAFGDRRNAERLLADAGQRVPELASRLRIVDGGGRWRVQAGPFDSDAAVQGAIDTVSRVLGLRPLRLPVPSGNTP